MIDLTLDVTPGMIASARENEEKARSGHLGTHFDVMDREFPPEYARRPGIVFDVSGVENRDIDLGDIDLDQLVLLEKVTHTWENSVHTMEFETMEI